ncbi:MAG: hypothetical protein ABII82_07805 [Verrucomicrobiota bacterium]
MKTQSSKLTLGALGFALLLNPASAAVVSLPLAQIPTEVKTGFQYGLGILFMVGFPDIKAKVEQRIRNVPPENRERAFITAAKSLALNQTVQSRGVTP